MKTALRGKLYLMGVCATLLLAGCQGLGLQKNRPQLVAAPDKTSIMIADAADRATRALESLAAVEQVRTPSATAAAAMVPNAPVELKRAVTMSWSGPVEPLARDIARRSGYTFNTVGNQPPSPILVSINADNEPLVEVLRDIGLQMGARADLKVDANAHLVEVIYASTVNGQSLGGSVPNRVPPSRRNKR